MYLVHAHLRGPTEISRLPDEAARLVTRSALPDDRVEHVCVHDADSSAPVVGVFLLSESLPAAETRVSVLLQRTITTAPELSGWQLVGAGVPLVTPFVEAELHDVPRL
jgi:hypothetical protein